MIPLNNTSFKIKDILKDHWSSFLGLNLNIRPVVYKDVYKVIRCQDPSMGYALFFCHSCERFLHVPFTCKSRFCNTCGGKYVEDRSKAISFKLVNCPHRHLVFTIPSELRIFFRKDRTLLHVLFRAAADTILAWFKNLSKSENFIPGFVSTLHTFGRDLKWNPHIHMILSEGASGNKTPWRTIKHFPFTMLRKRWQATLLNLMHNHLGHSFYSLKSFLFRKYIEGFYVNAPSRTNSSPKNSIDYIIRYTGKPPMAQSRILNYDGTFVTFYYEPHDSNERVVETVHAFDFIKRLIIHIPDEQFKMIRYYGIYAKKHKHSSKLFLLFNKTARKFYSKYNDWRSRILLTFHRDPLKCTCGNTLTFVERFIPRKNNYYLAKAPPLRYTHS